MLAAVLLASCVMVGCLYISMAQRDSFGMGWLMLFYYSLRPEPINTKQRGGRLENNDSILMMFVDESVHFRIRLRVRVD